MRKGPALALIAFLAASGVIMVESAHAQSTYATITDFSLKYVNHSYDVAPITTSSKDPYTGETLTTTVPGYHVENKTVDITIKNPSGASYYNFRWKGSFDDEWKYCPYNPNSGYLAYFIPDGYSVPFKASKSAYSTFSLDFLPKSITAGGSIDVQVQVLYGSFRAEPYVHAGWVGAPTYDFYFEGQAGDWSSTQTIAYGQTTTAPSPTIPEFPALAILPLLLVVPLIVLRFLKKRQEVKL